MAQQDSTSKPGSEKTSDIFSPTSNGHQPATPDPEQNPGDVQASQTFTDPGTEALPGGADIDTAVGELRQAEAPPDYKRVYDLVVELPEGWQYLYAADRQGAVQIAWLKYHDCNFRLRGPGTEHAVVLALGWHDSECRTWVGGANF